MRKKPGIKTKERKGAGKKPPSVRLDAQRAELLTQPGMTTQKRIIRQCWRREAAPRWKRINTSARSALCR